VQVGRLADGVIVGSALVKAVTHAIDHGRTPGDAAHDFVYNLKLGLNGTSSEIG
jgi:tryptophan synthase alpha subunit